MNHTALKEDRAGLNTPDMGKRPDCLPRLASESQPVGVSGRPRPTWQASIALRQVARRRVVGILAAGVLATLVVAIPALVHGRAAPSKHDEFCYLLMGDTFASGRLTNPTHRYWPHFETMHVLQQPTYQAKYPPAQGILLAVGQVLFDSPMAAVLLATGVAAASVCWMLYAWLPPPWAFLGGLLAAVHPGITIGWGQVYDGGQLSVIGGALVFGALRRMFVRPSWTAALTFGTGLALLANARPAEGFVVAVPALVLCVVLVFRRGMTSQWKATVIPLLAVLLVAASCMAFYNARVTGNPFRMPYQEHTAQYMTAPIFFGQSVRRDRTYGNCTLAEFYGGWELRQYEYQTTALGWLKGRTKRFLEVARFYCPLAFCIPLVMLPCAVRDAWIRFAAYAVVLLCAVVFVFWVWLFPHYLAPATCLFVLLVVQSLRSLRAFRIQNRQIGRVLVSLVLVGFLFASTYQLLQAASEKPGTWADQRLSIQQQLQNVEGQHLILVQYGANHNVHHEWVYNGADIDSAKVVWARSLGCEKDAALVDYFANRHVWHLRADETPAVLERAGQPATPE